MPGVVLGGVKRKRQEGDAVVKSRKAPRASTNGGSPGSQQAQVLLLEEQIAEGRKHYNNIVELQALVGNVAKKPTTATLAAVALCRVFCRMMAGEQLVKRSGASEADGQVVLWLRERVKEYVEALTSVWIGSPDAAQESTALTLLMRLVKEETSQQSRRAEQAWRTSTCPFGSLVTALLEKTPAEGARQEFVEKYVEEHDDVRFYTFFAIKQYFDRNRDSIDDGHVANAIDILAQIEGVPESQGQLEDWYGAAPLPENKQLMSLNAHRKTAQEAWLAVFRCGLSRNQRKRILGVATTNILPWFTTRIELLVDFLTDSFNEGGSVSLLALGSIFHLMTQRNLDYPDFYTKLYSLLDEDVLHSKHRSRFFRLLDQFMSSTHLPATMVASFIKRLARLSLQAPPGAIVWIVPWTYNMLKQHPACTFMLHRTYHPAHSIYNQNPAYEETGIVKDTFDAKETDPTATGAIDSSLWELETLASHDHPNVATLAKILSEQFTKREYSLEDFLDHSYGTLLDNELSRDLKKAPVVEWEIPKRIITSEEEAGGLNGIGQLLQKAIDARA